MIGQHWLINSLGILLNRDRGVSVPTLRTTIKLPVSFEITGDNPKWQTDKLAMSEDIILKYYDPIN